MSFFLTLLGWLLLGGALGYATERWRFVYVILLALLGISLITSPELPGLIGASDEGSWGETIAFLVGVFAGDLIAKREQ